jgi:hypothetical protein
VAKTLQELFHARSVRELFEGESPDETTIREAATAELILPKNRRPIEDLAVAALPGDCEVEDAWFEKLCPTGGEIQRQMEAAREGHRIAEEFPERGAYHGGPPIPDQGGIMQEECSMKTIGPFVPVPPDEIPPPMTGGFKMKIEAFDDYVARTRSELAAEGSQPSPKHPRAVGRVVGVARGMPIIEAD